ncbi:hypothetical protein F4802DRAFT_277531 [Xylaria palmicola]|nr:hypothetical protein F4802DRAFT_277531 [Xylaria palmicola]
MSDPSRRSPTDRFHTGGKAKRTRLCLASVGGCPGTLVRMRAWEAARLLSRRNRQEQRSRAVSQAPIESSHARHLPICQVGSSWIGLLVDGLAQRSPGDPCLINGQGSDPGSCLACLGAVCVARTERKPQDRMGCGARPVVNPPIKPAKKRDEILHVEMDCRGQA